MSLDTAALLAEMRAGQTELRQESTGAEVSFTDEQDAAWAALLPQLPVDAKVPVPVALLPASTRKGEASEGKRLENLAGDLSAALRSRYVVAYGAAESATEPRFTWVSGYAESTGKGDDKVYSGRIMIAVRSTIPARAKAVTSGKWNTDGTRVTA